jgi:hypothetical protein
MFGLASEMLLSSFSFAFQPVRAGKLSGRGRAPSSADAFDFRVSSPPRHVCRCDEYSSRIADLESRLTLSKRQAHMAMDKASKSCDVSFLAIFLFCFSAATLLAHVFCYCRYLPGLRR